MKAPEKYPTTDSTDPKIILCKAADIIEEFGWTKGDYQTGSKVCAMGAINAAVTGNPNTGGGNQRAYLAVSLLGARINTLDITGWNDHQVENEKEVIKMMRADSEC